MLVLRFEEFISAFEIKNEDMSKIDVGKISEQTGLIPIEKVMVDETSLSKDENICDIISNLNPADGTR